MIKDRVADTALAVLSFMMSQYMSAEYAEWLTVTLARPLARYVLNLSPRPTLRAHEC